MVDRRVACSIAVLAVVIACAPPGRTATSLKETVFGRFEAPPGSASIGDVSSPRSGQFGEWCPSYTRIFGTSDLPAFQRAVSATAEKAHWSAAQAETAELPPHANALFPVDGISALFIGEREEAQLSFWSSAKKVESETRFHEYASRLEKSGFDWNAYPLAVVLEILDRSDGDYCPYDDLGGLTRISGRVIAQATGLPVAGIHVSTTNGVALATTDAAGRYVHEERRRYGDKPYSIHVKFDAGPTYKAVFWQDASTIEGATEIAIGRIRNLEYLAIDATLQKPGVP